MALVIVHRAVRTMQSERYQPTSHYAEEKTEGPSLCKESVSQYLALFSEVCMILTPIET